jgi:O-antigen ligase
VFRQARSSVIERAADGLLFVLTIALPIYPWVAQTFPVWAPPLRLLLGAALAVAVIAEIVLRRVRALVPLAVVLLILAGVQVVAALRSPNSDYATRELLNWTLYLPLALVVWRLQRVMLVVYGLVLSGAVVVAGVVLQRFDVLGGTWGAAFEGGGTRRYTSFLQNPNDLGLVMAIDAVVVVALIAHTRGRRAVLLGLLAGTFALAVVFSSSRGSLLAMLLGLAIVTAVYVIAGRRHAGGSSKTRLGSVLVAGLIGVVVLGGSVVRDFRHSVFGAVIRGDASLETRVDRWRLLLAGPNDPMFGNGYGGFDDALDRNPRNLLRNPSAEEGLMAWGRLTGARELETVETPVYVGRRAVLLRGNRAGETARVGLGGADAPVIPGRRYRFSVALLSATPEPEHARLSVKMRDRSTGEDSEVFGSTVELDDGAWTPASDEFVAPPNAEFAIPVVTLVAPTGVPSAYLDDVRLSRVSPTFLDGVDAPLWAVRRELGVDNSFLRMFLESGLLGLASLVAVLVVAVRTRPLFGLPSPIAIAIPYVVLVMVLTRALTVDIFSQPLWGFMFWTSVGLIASATPALGWRGFGRPPML